MTIRFARALIFLALTGSGAGAGEHLEWQPDGTAIVRGSHWSSPCELERQGCIVSNGRPENDLSAGQPCLIVRNLECAPYGCTLTLEKPVRRVTVSDHVVCLDWTDVADRVGYAVFGPCIPDKPFGNCSVLESVAVIIGRSPAHLRGPQQ